MNIGHTEIEYNGVLVELDLLDDSILEISVKEAFFNARLSNSFFIDAYKTKYSVDMIKWDSRS